MLLLLRLHVFSRSWFFFFDFRNRMFNNDFKYLWRLIEILFWYNTKCMLELEFLCASPRTFTAESSMLLTEELIKGKGVSDGSTDSWLWYIRHENWWQKRVFLAELYQFVQQGKKNCFILTMKLLCDSWSK